MRLADRVFASFLGILVFSMLASCLTGALLVSRAVQSEATAQVESDISKARLVLENSLAAIEASSRLLSHGLPGVREIEDGATVAFIVDSEEAQVLGAAGIPPMAAASGFLLVPRQILEKHALPASSSSAAAIYPDERALCLFSASPGPLGWGFCATVLNGNESIAGRIRETIFERELYKGQPSGTVAIFQGSTLVSTAGLARASEAGFGAEVSAELRARVLDNGETSIQRDYGPDAWYISAYGPLRDSQSRAIGILRMGALQAKYDDMRARALFALCTVSASALVLLLAAASVLRGRIARIDGAGKTASGAGDAA